MQSVHILINVRAISIQQSAGAGLGEGYLGAHPHLPRKKYCTTTTGPRSLEVGSLCPRPLSKSPASAPDLKLPRYDHD